MKITLIGSGRVATHLALALQNQHQIVQVFSPKLAHAQKLAQQLDAQAISSPAQLDPQVDLVIVTVSDQAISQVIYSITGYLPQNLIVHTSGSTSLTVIEDMHAGSGIPLLIQHQLRDIRR